MTVSLLDKLAAETRRIEEDSEHSAKGHFNAADRLDPLSSVDWTSRGSNGDYRECGGVQRVS